MLNLNKNLTPITITNNKVLKKIWDKNLKLTLADVISNAESLFRHPMITNQEILIKCYQNKPLADIEEMILSNLK